MVLEEHQVTVPGDGQFINNVGHAFMHYLGRDEAYVHAVIEQTEVSSGARIWKMYNMGFVVRTKSVTIGFDLIRGEWLGIDGFSVEKDEMSRLIDQCDVLFVSHYHSDHAEEWVAQSFVDQGKPVLGIVGMPALNEVYIGQEGVGASMNGAPIKASSQTDLNAATIFINETETLVNEYPSVFAKLLKAGKTRRMSYDCYPHALVAAGHIDAVVDCNLQPYDYLPIVALIEAAGGLMTDWEGKPLTIHSDGKVLSAATPELLAQLIELVGGAA